MKDLKYIILPFIALAILATSGCKKDDDVTPSETDLQLTALINEGANWTLGPDGVMKDGFDVTSQFADFKINIGDKTYTTENGLIPVWPVSGTWDFQNNNPDLILRGDGVIVNVNLSPNALILTFTADGVNSSGRKSSVSGEYQFHLISE